MFYIIRRHEIQQKEHFLPSQYILAYLLFLEKNNKQVVSTSWHSILKTVQYAKLCFRDSEQDICIILELIK